VSRDTSFWLFASACSLALFVPAHQAAEPPPLKPRDINKSGIEGPVENLVKSPKAAIESPLKSLTASKTAAGDFVNPKVEPGKVKWHAGFDAACAAAKKSGKPVLLFQMMGKLDDQFC
jgi:hypothetical protein